MAFGNVWVETDPDGSIITVSQLDNSDRLIKQAVRERLEGDPAVPDLTGLLEVGSFAAAPKPRKGTARVYVDTDANILAFGATKREDGRLAVASDTGKLYHVATAGVVAIVPSAHSAVLVTSGVFADARIAASSVTQHQAALILTAAQITSGNLAYARMPTGAGTWTVAGLLTIDGTLKVGVGSTAAQAKPALVLYHNGALTTVSGAEVSLASYALPANTLAVDGQVIRITAVGRAAVVNGDINIKFGATTIAVIVGFAGGTGFWVEILLARSGAAQQRAIATVNQDNNPTVRVQSTVPAEALNGPVTIDFRGDSQGGGGVLQYDAVTIEYLVS